MMLEPEAENQVSSLLLVGAKIRRTHLATSKILCVKTCKLL